MDEWVSWRNSPIVPNRTYLGLSDSEIRERNIHPLTVRHKKYRHKYHPNYLRMELNNRGLWTPDGDERKGRLHRVDNWYRRHAIICQLGLTDAQKRRVMWLSNTDEAQEAARGYSLDEVTYCLCGIVCWMDDRPTHPSTKNRDNLFEKVQYSLDIGESRVQSVWGTLFAALGDRIE